MFCYIKGRLVMWKKMFKNFSSNTPETDFTKSKIKKTWQQEHPDGTTEETTPKNRNIAAIVALQVNKELPVSELLEFTPNKKRKHLLIALVVQHKSSCISRYRLVNWGYSQACKKLHWLGSSSPKFFFVKVITRDTLYLLVIWTFFSYTLLAYEVL